MRKVLTATALLALSGPAVAQSPPASPTQVASPDLDLRCPGAIERSGTTMRSQSYLDSNGQAALRQIPVPYSKSTPAVVLFKASGTRAWINAPSALSLTGENGEAAWWELAELKTTATQITGAFKPGWLRRYEVSIDRVTGAIRIDDFKGVCALASQKPLF